MDTLQIGQMEWVVVETASIAEIRGSWETWLQAREDWLASKRAKTRRAYVFAWDDFFRRFLEGERGPWQVGGSDVVAWQREMEDSGLGAGTINQRLAAVSSFYVFCGGPFTVMVNGRELPLADHNPVTKVERADVVPYFKATALDASQVARLLVAIRRDSVQGLRDYALVSAYLYLGRRSSELARLCWGDVFENKGRLWYRWTGKGGRAQTNEMAPFVWEAILVYLRAAGRLDDEGEMAPEAFIFTALRDNAVRLPSVQAQLAEADLSPGQYEPTARPLHSSTIYRLVQKYCRKAGLPEIRTHDLRHTAADLREGEDLRETAHFLGHSNLNTTEIYRRHRALRVDLAAGRAHEAVEEEMRRLETRKRGRRRR